MEDVRAPVERRRSVAASAAALLLAGGTLVCCALPVLLVTLGLGGAVAALTAAAPWLVTLSHYKLWIFAGAILALLAAGVLLYRPGRVCPADPELARACTRLDRISRTFWWLGLTVWLVGAFVAFAWVPLQQAIARGQGMNQKCLPAGLLFLVASVVSHAEGHGPVFGLATPTLSENQWSTDTGLMRMQHNGDGRWRLREMIGYGITEDLQLNISFALDTDAAGYVANSRGGAMMGQPGTIEAGLLWRFHRIAPAVGQRRESTLLLSVADGADAGNVDTGASIHLGAVTGYASRTIYWWLGAGAQRFRNNNGLERGDLTYATAVFGWRPPIFRGDYPKPDWRFFAESVAEHAARDRQNDIADNDSGGTRIMLGPSVLGLFGPWGMSAGVLWSLHEDLNGRQPQTGYRAKLVFTYWF